MNKICTSKEQSQKLVKLGVDIDTADMYIGNYVGKSGKVDGTNIHYYLKGESFGAPEIIPAWSLSALLELIPNYVINKVDDKIYANLYYDLKSSYDDLVDAAFEMVCLLLENKKFRT